MAEVAQYNFSLQELTEVLIRHQGVQEGLWAASFNLGVGIGIMGPGPGEIYPSAMVQIISAALTKVEPGQNPMPPGAMDAAQVNPRRKTKSKEK